MPKHIVKKIWIIIFGIAVIGAIAVMVMSSYITTPSCGSDTGSSYVDSDGIRQVIPRPVCSLPAPLPRDKFIDDAVNNLAVFVVFELFIGACLSIVLEIIYFVFNKVKQREAKINRANLFIGLAVILLYVAIFLYIAVSNMIIWNIAYLFIGLYLLLLLTAIAWVVRTCRTKHSGVSNIGN